MGTAIEPYPSPKRSRAQAAAKPRGILPDPDGRLRKRIETIAHRLLDAASDMVDQVAAPPPPLDPIAVETQRRQVANTIGTWRFCARDTCRRARCCRRDPATCLHTVLPLMPDILVGLLRLSRPKRRQA